MLFVMSSICHFTVNQTMMKLISTIFYLKIIAIHLFVLLMFVHLEVKIEQTGLNVPQERALKYKTACTHDL